MLFTEKVISARIASIGGCADNNLEFAELLFKLFDYCLGRVYFANTDGMKPNAFFLGMSPANSAESLSPAGPVPAVPYGPIYDHRDIGKTG